MLGESVYPQTGQLIVEPVKKGSGFEMEGYFLWCPTVVNVAGTYHLFASRWPAEFGMDGWLEHSEIIRATSEQVTGPYVFEEVVMQKREGFWDHVRVHNPKVLQVDDKYILYYISSANSTGYAVADSITGPWRRTAHVVMPFSNPAPLVEPDKRIYVFGRKAVDGRRIAQAYRSRSYDGAYRQVHAEEGNLLPQQNELEDPTIWRDKAGRYHVLCSDFGGYATGIKKAGVHYVSKDGIRYDLMSNKPVYTADISYDDDTYEKFKRRERPFVYVGSDGIPQALFTACLPQDGPSRIEINLIK